MVERCRDARYPSCIGKMSSGWAVMGERQVLPGYCLLLPDPVVPHLNALAPALRGQFLADMALVGDALLELTGGLRINYAIFGNLEPALHAHIFPRNARGPAPGTALGARLECGAGIFGGAARRFHTALGSSASQASRY